MTDQENDHADRADQAGPAAGQAGPPAEQAGPRPSRRALFRGLGAAGAAAAVTGIAGGTTAPAAAAWRARRRAYVLVLDGLRPDEIDSGLMPTVRALRDHGLRYPHASALPVLETIPNHAMMMTGVRPDRSGVPANDVLDRSTGEPRTLDRPGDLRADTVIEQLNRTGLTTATVLSKEYLHGIFGDRATHVWEPAPVVPVSEHAPDLATTDAAIDVVEEHDPQLVFINLGDIDRVGHSDLTGTTLEAFRTATLAATDQQVDRFQQMLKRTGRWEDSVLVVLADHSMDWSRPDRVVGLQPVMDGDPFLAGNVVAVQNGGADLLYWTGDPARRDRAVDRMQRLAREVPGVLEAHDRAATDRLRLGPEAGEVVAFCEAGWRFSEPTPVSNPIPGNHGHPATRPIPFFLSGGHPVVPSGSASSAHARTVDVAPTLARFFGLPAPRGGFDGRSRL